MRVSRKLLDLVTRREPAWQAGYLRVVLAATSLLQLAELVPVLEELGRDEVIRTPYLSAIPALPGPAIAALTAAWAAAALAALLGWMPRFGVTLLAVFHIGVLFYDRQLYSNHFFLLTLLLLLLALTDCGARPRLTFTHPPPEGPGTLVAWPLVLIRTQLTSVYLFAGLSKLNPDFLAGRILAHYLEESLLPGRVVWDHPRSLTTMAVAIVAVELFLAAGLWIPRVRRLTVGVGLLFHVSILVALGPSTGLVIFAVESVALYPLFLTTASRDPSSGTFGGSVPGC